MKFRQLLCRTLLLLCLSSVLLASTRHDPILVLDASNISQLPKDFRTTSDPIRSPGSVSLVGLRQLHAMGSGQFSKAMLEMALKKLPPNASMVVVDLRQETHGFIDGRAVSLYGKYDWANVGKSDQKIHQEEKNFIAQLQRKPKVQVSKINKTPDTLGFISHLFPVNTAYTEAELVKKYHLGYQRFYVTDHCQPKDAQVDAFIQFAKKIPENTWLYFHCRAGKGRTTTFMLMYDMLHNAKKVSYQDILKRRVLLGGKDFNKKPDYRGRKEHYKACYQSRLVFLKAFYDYCRTNKDHYATSWTEWSNSR